MSNSESRLLAYDKLAYAFGEPQAHARLKQEYADFCVDEILGFDFTDAGDHLCVQIKKTAITTTDLAKEIAKKMHVNLIDVSYSGMKDKRGICTQWYSIKKPRKGSLQLEQLNTEGVQVLEVRENSRKIHIGSHKGNHFQIRLRGVTDELAEIPLRLQKLVEQGAPNYFGQQRLGFELSNVHSALDFFADVAKGQHLTKRHSLKKSMLLSASRGYLFNLILSHRVSAGNWNSQLPGEVMALDGTSRFFVPEQSPEQHAILQQRLQELDVHPTGLLAGAIDPKDKYQASANVLRLEQEQVAECPQLQVGLQALQVRASRRPLRARVTDLSSVAEGADFLSLQFTLATGCYATSVLREVCKTTEPE